MNKPWKILTLVALIIGAIFLAYHLRAIFMPVMVALLLAYILNPIVAKLEERKIPRRSRPPRSRSTSLSTLRSRRAPHSTLWLAPYPGPCPR